MSPGRTGRSHFRLSIPGDPIDALSLSQPSVTIRMKSAQVCQPDAASPPSSVSAAAASSRWKGCGSNSAAKATISARVTVCGPKRQLLTGLEILEIAHGHQLGRVRAAVEPCSKR